MSYHDRLLVSAAGARSRARVRAWRAALRGVNEITLCPSLPAIDAGSIKDDWLAVGSDLRSAMKRARLGE